MKVENYTGTADTFTFPHNPQVFDDAIDIFTDQRDYAYAFSYFGKTNPLKARRNIVINGHFDGASKSTHYIDLANHMNSNKLKKLYFDTDKFYIVLPLQIKKTHSGSRTNFIDYVASFVSPFGILFSNTQKDDTFTTGTTSWGDDTIKNAGDAFTPIEKITGTVSDTDTVTIKDVDDNGFSFTADGTGTVTIYLIYMTDLGSDNYFTEYLYAITVSTIQKLTVATNNKSMILGLDADQKLSELFAADGSDFTNITNPTFYFRDGYMSD